MNKKQIKTYATIIKYDNNVCRYVGNLSVKDAQLFIKN